MVCSSHNRHYAKTLWLLLGSCLEGADVWVWCGPPRGLDFLLRWKLNGSYLSLAHTEDMEYLKGLVLFQRFLQPVAGAPKGVPYD